MYITCHVTYFTKSLKPWEGKHFYCELIIEETNKPQMELADQTDEERRGHWQRLRPGDSDCRF